MKDLRKAVEFEEFDYQVLLDALKGYKKPRDKISLLLTNGDIIRVKKGLYIFGESWRKGPYSIELLANLIYGPSYISGEYALAHYGLIPERVYIVTCVTTGKKKAFNTPVGNFTYQHLNSERYQPGIILKGIDAKRSCLFASKEKALADVMHFTPLIESEEAMSDHLLENMRMDAALLKKIDSREMKKIAESYGSKNVDLLNAVLEKMR